MALKFPSGIPKMFGAWEDWEQRFQAQSRGSQVQRLPSGSDVIDRVGLKLVRRLASVVSHNNGNVPAAVNDVLEFKRGGVVIIALNKQGKLGMVWRFEKSVRLEDMDAYQAEWDDHSSIHLSQRDREEQYTAFLRRVLPKVGAWSLQVPRGHGECGVTSLRQARVEVQEELGFKCLDCLRLGRVGENNAPALNTYCLAQMDEDAPVGQDDEGEGLGTQWVTMTELQQAFNAGYVRDPYTLSILQVLQFADPTVYASIAV